jgi:hypothetical protein
VIKGVSLKSKMEKKYITIKGVKLRKPSIFVVIGLHPLFTPLSFLLRASLLVTYIFIAPTWIATIIILKLSALNY